MNGTTQTDQPTGGFSFDLTLRNQALVEKLGSQLPKPRKTGTTIAGIIFKDGIVLGGDTRATDGDTVADKNCRKIHYIAPNIYCCGAGTAADTESVTNMISSKLELLRLTSGRQSRVVTAMTMLKRELFKYQGFVSAALVLGGFDHEGPSLYNIFPHGSTDKLPFVTMGSGSLAAMAVFENGWHKELGKQDAINLVHQAIRAGIYNDLGSGGNVDLCIITKDGADFRRTYEEANPRFYYRLKGYKFEPGTTAVLSSSVEIVSTSSSSSSSSSGASATVASQGAVVALVTSSSSSSSSSPSPTKTATTATTTSTTSSLSKPTLTVLELSEAPAEL